MTKYAQSQTPARGHTLALDDIELYYEEYGAGEPWVLLHGFGGSSRNWHPFVAELAKSHLLLVVDLRGHGRSTNPSNRFTHRQAAEDVLRLLDALGIRQFSAMGMSSGAMTLLHMATTQPERIESLALISATSHFPEQARAIMHGASLQKMPRAVQAMYRECATRGETQVQELLAQFNAFHADYDDVNFSPQLLSTITARTLVVHGDRDRFFPVEIAVGIYRAIPDCALWIIPDGEHVPVYERSVPFIETVRRFLT